MSKNQFYCPPQIELVEVQTEKGFAQSGEVIWADPGMLPDLYGTIDEGYIF